MLSSGGTSEREWEVEAVNKIIKSILKKWLEKAKGKWVDELPMVLWAYRIIHKFAINHTFTLVYRSKAMILMKLKSLSIDDCSLISR